MELELLNEQGQTCGSVTVSDGVFGRAYNEALIHQIVVAYQANARQGSRAQKDRSQVRHSTRKPWRQKGTGRARAGMVSSPLWRGGGCIFPNSPEENFSQKINKKMFRAGMCSILSQLVREGRLSAIGDIQLETPKVKLFIQKLFIVLPLLMITDHIDTNLYLASRNLSNITVTEPYNADPLSLIKSKKILVTQSALPQIESLLQ